MKFSSLKKNIDINLVLLLAGFYAVFNLVYIARSAYLRANFPNFDYRPWRDFLVIDVLIDWITVVIYMTIMAISTKRLLNKKYSWTKIISLHIVFSIFIGFIIRLIFDLYMILTGKMNFAQYHFEESVNRFVNVVHLNFLIYFAMIFIIYTYYYVKEVKAVEKQRGKLEAQLINARMKMLSSQLQPHFLFNTLNSISVLMDLNVAKAKDTIADLSDFLRAILYSSDQNKITLKKELDTLEFYLNILQTRFSDHLKIHKDIDHNLLHHKVPALLLQPLIENSVKHGYSYFHTELEIHIIIKEEEGFIIIKILNNGKIVNQSHSKLLEKGFGLANIHGRLENLYGSDYFFQLKNRSLGKGVETIVKIPKE